MKQCVTRSSGQTLSDQQSIKDDDDDKDDKDDNDDKDNEDNEDNDDGKYGHGATR